MQINAISDKISKRGTSLEAAVIYIYITPKHPAKFSNKILARMSFSEYLRTRYVPVENKYKKSETPKAVKEKKRHYTENSRNISQNQRFFKVMRQIALDRDNRRCVGCGATKHLEVHHIVGRKNGGTDDINNLITLCPMCHAEKHKGQGVYNFMIKQAKILLETETK